MSSLTAIITAEDQAKRDQALDAFCHSATLGELLSECRSLEDFRHTSGNLYEQVARTDFVQRV